MTKKIENRYFDVHDSLNDAIQIADNKIAFLYMANKENLFINKLCIIIINIIKHNEWYYNYYELYSKSYVINFENYTPTRIKAFNFNGFLLFSSSGLFNIEDYFYNKENFNNYLSMFMVLGYSNGTDTTINISKFIFKENHRIENNFFTFLYKNFTIENNFFGYQPFNLIKLVSVPKEITIYEYNLKIPEEKLLEDSLMISGCIDYSIDNEQCDYDYTIEENENLIKTSQYYYIDDQYCVSYYDPELEEYLPKPPEESTDEVTQEEQIQDNKFSRLNIKSYTDIYCGRVNRLKFKLCHDYCETCKKLGTNKNDQKCSSCLPEYQYNYFYFLNRQEFNPAVCFPENYYYNIYARNDDNKFLQCYRGDTKYYINTTDNKRICFEDRYPCPPSYPNYNEETKECFSCDYTHFKKGECSADNLTMDSCTQCDYECFKIGGCNFNNFNTTSEDFMRELKMEDIF